MEDCEYERNFLPDPFLEVFFPCLSWHDTRWHDMSLSPVVVLWPLDILIFYLLVLFPDAVLPVHCFNCNSKAVSPLDLLLQIPLCFLVCIIHREESIVCVWNTQADEHIQIKCLHTVCTHTHTHSEAYPPHHALPRTAPVQPRNRDSYIRRIFSGASPTSKRWNVTVPQHITRPYISGAQWESGDEWPAFSVGIFYFCWGPVSAVTRACELLQLCRDGALILMTTKLGR